MGGSDKQQQQQQQQQLRQQQPRQQQSSSSSPSLLLLQRLQKLDVAISTPIFRLSFPKPIEFIISIPGNLMGPPSLQIVAPLWLVVLSSSSSTTTTTTFIVALFLTIFLLLLPFILFLRTNNMKMISNILYPNVSFAVSPLVGTAIIYHYYDDNNNNNNNNNATATAASLAYHGIILYCLSCSIIIFLKHETKRLRPCVTMKQYISLKNFKIIPTMLSQHASFTSFPSGDVMGATSWSIPLWYIGYTRSATILVLLTAFGRMFFLAHHFGDTLGGFTVCFSLHLLLEWFGGSSSSLSEEQQQQQHEEEGGGGGGWPLVALPKPGTAQWYHPILALGTLVFASQFRKSDHK